MCGIIGYVGTENAVQKLVTGLEALEYRGYDSAGVAFFENEQLKTVKCRGRIEALRNLLGCELNNAEIYCGIGHTRWATHGEPSDRNSHPHGTENVSIVHNGIIENYVEIKKFLQEKGYIFESETDTETAAKLIDFFYKDNPVDAIREAQKMLRGSFAICAVFKNENNKLFAFRKDNPIIVAPTDAGNFVVSEISAVIKYTKRFRRLEKGEIAVITNDNITILDPDNEPTEISYETVDWDAEAAEKGGFPHFMLKEIYEEPDVVKRTVSENLSNYIPDLSSSGLSDEMLRKAGRIHIVACGTAMHAGLVGKIAIEKLGRVPVSVVLASEFRYQNPILDENDIVIVISQSGETADTLAALRLAKERGIFTLGIVNVMGSAIAREADGVLYTLAGPEIAVASTKAYVVQLAVLYVLALKIGLVREKLSEKDVQAYTRELLEAVPEGISRILKRKEEIREVAKKYKDNKSIFFIGRGMDYAICCEAALKMKEISYIHCESYAAGELKHGTISLVTDGVPVFAFATDHDIIEKTLSNIKETAARGARILIFCGENNPVPENAAEDIIELPQLSELFMPTVTATAAQLLAYYTSVELELDVDKPRNLAKSVTVE
ncbi:MAG: glutamine--fructose-6-phosphate transaminase (isomerizing) [Ruminococcaceae bacterium]|nr:glutamine--fructose-6-phosphate transaminase (isomerizing) [Oscillospiraceae bacterium]